MIRIKKYSLTDIAIFGMIAGFCAVRNISIVMYAAQIAFLAAMLGYISKRDFAINMNSYLATNVLFTIWAVASLLWAPDMSLCLDELRPLVQITVICGLLSVYLDNEKKVEFIIGCFLVSSILLLIYLFLKTPVSEFVSTTKITTSAASSKNRIGRSIGFHPNELGTICAFFALYWVYALSKFRRYRMIGIPAITLLTIVILFTKSRKALIVMFLAVLIYFFFYKQRKRSWWIITIALAIVAVGVAFWAMISIPALYSLIGFRLVKILGLFDSSITIDASIRDRIRMIQAGITMFLDHPVLGVGFGNFAYYFKTFYAGWLVYSHNNFVEILSGLGMIGFSLYYAVPFLILLSLVKNWKKYCRVDRKLTALIFSFITVKLITDFVMVSYDDEFLQIGTMTCYCAMLIMRKASIRRR